jgi:pimeloyl-ACP methyl ester carboxylesterase
MSPQYVPRRAPEALELTVRDLRCHVTCWKGTEPEPVFLLHGWADCGATFQFLVDALPERRTLLAPDWRGFGRSEWPADGYWFPDYFADLDALLDVLSPSAPATLIGHSMGANIALIYAGVRPERVRRVVCVEGFGLPRTDAAQAPDRYRQWLRQLREPQPFPTFPSLETFAHYLARRNPKLPPGHAEFVAAAWGETQADGSFRMRSDPAHKRVNPVLYRREEAEACWREVSAPVLAVIGGHSEFVTRLGEDGQPENLARLVRRLELCTIPEASHMVHHERPTELARVIEAFLERT